MVTVYSCSRCMHIRGPRALLGMRIYSRLYFLFRRLGEYDLLGMNWR